MDKLAAKILVYKSGLSQKQIARRMRISGGYLSELIHNKKPFPDDLLYSFKRIVVNQRPRSTCLKESGGSK